MCSALRTVAFSGSKWDPVDVCGKIDVSQVVTPIVTRTGNEPNPRASLPNNFVIIAASWAWRNLYNVIVIIEFEWLGAEGEFDDKASHPGFSH
jgi:hypothetical protein